MFRKRTRFTSQVWTVIFLLLFNDVLAQTTTATVATTPLEEYSKIAPSNRTVLQKIIEDSKTKISTSLVNDEKHEPIFTNSTNSTNFRDQIKGSSTREPLKEKESKKSISDEKINEEPAIPTIDSLHRATSVDPIVKSKSFENNVNNKTLEFLPDEENLSKLTRNKGKTIFLEAFKEGSRHNVKKSETNVTPKFDDTDDFEIEEHELEHKEQTTSTTIKTKDFLEDFDIESFQKEDKNEEKDEEGPREDVISLANDTNVNFKHKNIKNETNIISENDDGIEMDFGPKHEVEVVKNVTYSPIMRFVHASEEKKELTDTDKSIADKKKKIDRIGDKNFTKKSEDESDFAPSVNDVNLKNDDKVKIDIPAKIVSASNIEISSNADIPLFNMDISSSKIDITPSKVDTSSKTDIQLKIDISSSKVDIPSSKAISSSVLNTSSIDELSNRKESLEMKESTENLTETTKISDPAPKARTISFSGINEFIPENIDSKIVTSRTTISESPLSKRPFRLDEEIEQRPYPYLKTDIRKAINEQEVNKATSFRKEIEESTEETSAYENTIGRRVSDKKLVITEPSVVIENSIQQLKSTYYKRSGNSTRHNSTISDFGLRSTTSTYIDESNVTATIEKYFPTSSTIKTDSVDEEITMKKEEIPEKEQRTDLNENGITENNLQTPTSHMKKDSPSSLEKIMQKTGEDFKEKLTEKSAEKVKDVETKKFLDTTKTVETSKHDAQPEIDVQSNVEDSKLSFSHMNATESSTQHSVTDKTDAETIPYSTESSFSTSTKGILVTTEKYNLSTTPDLNFNKSEVHLNSTTSISTVLPETTTTIEYEFVGLKETTIPGEEEIKDLEESSNFDKITNSVKAIGFNKSSDSDRFSATLPYTVRDEATESNTLNSRMIDHTESTTINNTEEVVTQISESITEISVNSSEDRSMTNKETTTAIVETMDSDETISFLTTTIASDQDDNSSVSEITLNNDETTNIEDFESTTEATLFKRNTTKEMNTTNTKLLTSSEVPVTTVTEHSVAMDTTVMWTSISTHSPKLFSVTTQSTVLKSTPEISTDAPPSLSPEDIKVLVRIVFEGTWSDVCPRLQFLREMLSDLLTSSTEEIVSPRQIIFHQTQCTEGVLAMTSPSSETPLTSVLIYIVDEDGNFHESMTRLLPNLYKVSTIAFPLPVHSFLLVQEADSGNAIAVVIVSSVAFICLVLLAGLLFIMRKRQTRFNYGERCRPVSLDAYSLDSVSAYNSVRRKGAIRASKRSYGNPTFEDSSAIPSHPLNFAGLSSFCNDVNAISEEFTGIPQITAKIDELPQGAEVKNRYANVIPLPETRVPLQKLNNDPLTEFINASYVRGLKNATKYYVACQAPTESTVTDFWRMIWEQQSKIIIMLTDLVENGVEKCAEYIPPSEVTDCHRLYGDYQVTLKKRETKEKYAISTLHLKNLENNTFREVSHIWYLWPPNGVPDSASLIAVLLEARALQRGGPGPIVVHCSPGTGRTGTLIALDLGIRQYEITRTVDVPRVVYTIRRDRAGAVQTKEQYAFIYKALNLYATKLSGGALEST